MELSRIGNDFTDKSPSKESPTKPVESGNTAQNGLLKDLVEPDNPASPMSVSSPVTITSFILNVKKSESLPTVFIYFQN